MADDDRRAWAGVAVVGGVQAAGDLDAGAVEADVRVHGSGQRLMVLTAEPGTPSHERLRILAAWTAEPHADPETGHSSALGRPRPGQ